MYKRTGGSVACGGKRMLNLGPRMREDDDF